MAKTQVAVDNKEILKLVKEIDEQGTRLTRTQIDFVAGIIDGKQKKFSPEQAERVRKLHDKKVVNGKPEDDYDF